ncbi:MAG: NTP transferase domain-containing protein [Candidatus Omnitrophica bacterium]|nr:NTP transferase domain-containing protein [Candidatus Omnitrophota bacterium]
MAQRIAVTFVIMAGGRGKRLQPLTATRPKVCLSLDGKRSLLQATIERLRPVWPKADWLIVTTQGQADIIRRDLPGNLHRDLLVEPEIKNTAACLTLAAATVAARDPRRVMVVVPADHWVGDADAYRRSVRAAIRAAVREDAIAMIGIRPTHAHTGLGYLCAGPSLRSINSSRIFRLSSFVEKPPRTVAARLAKRPRTYWNNGSFIARADKFLEVLTVWLPGHTRRLIPLAVELRSPSTRSARSGLRSLRSLRARVQAAYRGLQPVSFDHGVMNHLQEGIVVEGLFLWSDVGTLEAWRALARKTDASPGA